MSEISREQVLTALKKGATTAITADEVTTNIVYDEQADAIMELVNPLRKVFLCDNDTVSSVDEIEDKLQESRDHFSDMYLPDGGVDFYTFWMVGETLHRVKGTCQVEWASEFSMRKNVVTRLKVNSTEEVPYQRIDTEANEWYFPVNIGKEYFIPDLEFMEI